MAKKKEKNKKQDNNNNQEKMNECKNDINNRRNDCQ